MQYKVLNFHKIFFCHDFRPAQGRIPTQIPTPADRDTLPGRWSRTTGGFLQSGRPARTDFPPPIATAPKRVPADEIVLQYPSV